MSTLIIPDHQMVPFDVDVQSNLISISWTIRPLRTFFTDKGPLDAMDVLHVTSKPDISMKDFPANFTFNAQLIFVGFQM